MVNQTKNAQKKPARDEKKAKSFKKVKFQTDYQRERDEELAQSKRSKRARKAAERNREQYKKYL